MRNPPKKMPSQENDIAKIMIGPASGSLSHTLLLTFAALLNVTMASMFLHLGVISQTSSDLSYQQHLTQLIAFFSLKPFLSLAFRISHSLCFLLTSQVMPSWILLLVLLIPAISECSVISTWPSLLSSLLPRWSHPVYGLWFQLVCV